MTIEVSVVVCTRNRAASLTHTLASLARLEARPTHEIIVVDNGSTDTTADVIASARSAFKVPFTVIHEHRTGQARARNHALSKVQGSWVAFTDDDVRVSPTWLEKLTGPLRRSESDLVVGGIRLPPDLRPGWMDDGIAGYFCDTAHFAYEPLEMIGANMAFSRKVLEKVPGFDEQLGPGRLGFYDDTLFGRQSRRAGYRIQYVADAQVEHHFDASRLDSRSIARMFRNQGRCLGYLAWHWEHYQARGILRRLLRQLPACVMGFVRERTGVMSASRFQQMRACNEDFFFCLQYWIESRRPRRYPAMSPVQ